MIDAVVWYTTKGIPITVGREKLPDDVCGEYSKRTARIAVSVDVAGFMEFHTYVHEWVHAELGWTKGKKHKRADELARIVSEVLYHAMGWRRIAAPGKSAPAKMAEELVRGTLAGFHIFWRKSRSAERIGDLTESLATYLVSAGFRGPGVYQKPSRAKPRKAGFRLEK